MPNTSTNTMWVVASEDQHAAAERARTPGMQDGTQNLTILET